MKRRSFIWLIAVNSFIVLLPIISCNSKNSFKETLAKPESLSRISNSTKIKNIGFKYLTLVPSEADKTQLESILLNKITDNYVLPKDVANLIKKKISQDFKESNTIVIDGWILSLTEARQCALYSIVN